jgi:hypothetical protein
MAQRQAAGQTVSDSYISLDWTVLCPSGSPGAALFCWTDRIVRDLQNRNGRAVIRAVYLVHLAAYSWVSF